MLEQQANALLGAVAATPDPQPSNKAAKAEPGDLRGIPVQAMGVGGCSPGTHPERTTLNRLTRQGL